MRDIMFHYQSLMDDFAILFRGLAWEKNYFPVANFRMKRFRIADSNPNEQNKRNAAFAFSKPPSTAM